MYNNNTWKFYNIFFDLSLVSTLGIGLPLNLWEKLKELTPEIDEVLKEKK